jgi:hypothetical protein
MYIYVWVCGCVGVDEYVHEYVYVYVYVYVYIYVCVCVCLCVYYRCLGHGSHVDEKYPRMLRSLRNKGIIQVAAGSQHVAALSSSGQVCIIKFIL